MRNCTRELLTAVALLCCFTARAADFEATNDEGVTIYYNVTEGAQVEVTWGGANEETGTESYEGDIVIPQTVEHDGVTYTVTAVGAYAFATCSVLTSVTLPETLTTIGDEAFGSCDQLAFMIIPDNVTQIGAYAFENCSAMEQLTLGRSVTDIGNFAFYGCSALVAITALPTTPPTCNANVFQNVDTGNVTLTVQKGCASDYASSSPWSDFADIEELAGVGDRIELNGIYYNILTDSEVEVTYGGAYSFAGTATYTGDMVIPEIVYHIGMPYSVTGIGTYAFSRCSLTSVEMPATVTYIGAQAFSYCSSLVSVNVPDGVETIGDWAFYTCTKLASVTLGENLTSIGEGAFNGCTSLTAVTIPASVTELGDYIFEQCPELAEIVVDEDNQNYCSVDNVMFTKDMLTIVRYPAGSTVTDYEIPATVTTVGIDAFCFSQKLVSVVIPAGVTSVEDWAFEYCTALTSITSLNTTPPVCGNNVFDGTTPARITLLVPDGARDAYAEASTWSAFVIEEMEVDAIDTIVSDAEKRAAAIYTTDGKRLTAPGRGINIVRYSDGSTGKVVVK